MRSENPWSRWSGLAAAAGSALLLGNCVHTADTLPAPLRVDLPEICEQILEPVDLRAFGAEEDAIAAFLEAEAAAIVANERIKAGRACVREQRQQYAGRGEG